jgi:hypothetical protein
VADGTVAIENLTPVFLLRVQTEFSVGFRRLTTPPNENKQGGGREDCPASSQA